jgi:putative transposase
MKELSALKSEYPWLKAAPIHALQQGIVDVHDAIVKFYKGAGGYPKHKSKNDDLSFRESDPNCFRIMPNGIYLPKVKRVKAVLHREIPGTAKEVTVIRHGEEWYACIACKVIVDEPQDRSHLPSVGIDIGVAKPIVMSNGDVIMLPQVSMEERHKLAVLHKKVSRKKKGSHNRRKAVRNLNRYHRHLARRRKDGIHKATTKIVNNHGVIFIENLHVTNMTASAAGTIEAPGKNVTQKSGLNRSILDVSPRFIRTCLEYKAKRLGYEVNAVPAPYTSQKCSKCGFVHADNRRSQSEFVCLKCGYAANADHNAARNIRNKGLVLYPRTAGIAGIACQARRNVARQQEARSFTTG